MSFEAKEDLQKVCEAILGYQKGLEEIDKYVDLRIPWKNSIKEQMP